MTYGLAWLQDTSAHRCILIEAMANVAGVETLFTMSSAGFNSTSSDTPANTTYLPIIENGVQVNESISLDGTPSISYSNIEISNPNGVRDAWLDYIWVNRTIKVYIGDLAWAKADFKLIFDGIIFDIDSSARENLVFKMRDKFQRLNNPVSIQEVKDIYPLTPDTSDYYHSLIPLTFGECFNIKPLLIDNVALEYAVHHTGGIERIIEVRDNGIPLLPSAYTVNFHSFTLHDNPSGEITASVQGDKNVTVYSNTIAAIILRIVKDFGDNVTKFVDADIDLTNFANFEAAHPQPVGIYIADKANVIEVIQKLASSVGAVVTIGRDGKLRLIQITSPDTLVSQFSVTDADMVESSLHITGRLEVKGVSRIGYCKNWTVQKGLVTAIPEGHKAYFAAENSTIIKINAPVRAAYKLTSLTEIRETLLLTKNDAIAEAVRERDFFSVPRTTYEFEGLAMAFQFSLGDVITVYSSRFGLAAGKKGLVIRLQPDWLKFTVLVEVLI